MNYNKLNLKLLFEVIVTESMREDFKLLNFLKSKVRLLSKDSPEKEIMAKEIRYLRKKVKDEFHSIYKIKISNNRSSVEDHYNELPEPYNFKQLADDFISEIRDARKVYKEFNKERKNILGFNYETQAGVFLKEKSILDIANRTNPLDRIAANKTPHPKIKGNYLGFELELICKMSHEQLTKAFIKKGLAGYVNIKRDGSIQTEYPNEYPHEVTILCKQQDMSSIIKDVCSVLNSSACEARVNNTCGFHLHLDMRNRDPYHCYHNLVKGLPMLNRMVPSLRVKGAEALRYCKQNKTADLKTYYPDPTNLRDLHDADRYQAINPAAVRKFKTLEVRLHSGTTNINKILNWAEICVSIIEAKKLEAPINNAEEYSKYINSDTKILDYINTRILFFDKAKDSVDTKADHAMDVLQNIG